MANSKRTSEPGCAIFACKQGHLGLAWSADGIVCVQLPEKDKAATLQRLRLRFPRQDVAESEPPQYVKAAAQKLVRFLDSGTGDLSGIKLDWNAVPPFHRQVYEQARRIPSGKLASYGQLACAAGSAGAARAVGQAMARNPFPLIVPCHRVVGSDGKPGGFSAYGGLHTKERLLRQEGVCLETQRLRKQPRAAQTSRREGKYDATAGGAAAGVAYTPGKKVSQALPFDPEAAVSHLSRVDRRLGRVIEKVGPLRLELDEMLTPFEALAESIVYQQLTGKAAATIFRRVKELYGQQRLPEPKHIVATPDHRLRSAGLSSAKAAALKDLASKHASGLIPSLKQLEGMDDQEIIERLTAVRGVGKWTVEMLLIFRLGRPDVLPATDYGVRKGYAKTYKLGDNLPTPKELEAAGEKWRPFRSVAAWYMWRCLEL